MPGAVTGADGISAGYAPMLDAATSATEATRAMTEALREESDAYVQSRQAIEQESALIDGLIGTIYRLSDGTELSTGQNALLLASIHSLGEALPGVSDAIDEQTGLLTLSRKEVDALAEAHRAAQEAALSGERVTELQIQQANATKQLSEAEGTLADVRLMRESMNDRINQFTAEGIELTNAESLALGALIAEEAKLEAQEIALAASIESLGEEVASAAIAYAEAVSQYGQDSEAARQAAQNLIDVQEKQAAAAKAVADAYDPLKASIEETITSSADLAQTLEDEAEAFQQSLAQIDAQVAKYKELGSELASLAAKEGKTGEETARMNAIMGQLNTAFPALGLKIDAVTGKLSMSEGAIHTWLDGWGGMEKSATAAERLTQVMEGQLSAAEALAEVEDDLTATHEALAAKQAELADMTDEDASAKEALQAVIDDLIAKEESLAGLKDILIAKESELTGEYQSAAEAQAAAQQLINDAIESGKITKEQGAALSAEYAASLEAEATAAEEAAKRQQEAYDSLVSEMEKAYERYASMAQSMTDTIKLNDKITIDSARETWQENAKIMQHWTDNMNELGKRDISKEFLEYIRAAGPEAAALTQQMVDATDGELQAMEADWKAAGDSAMNAMEAAFAEGGPLALSAASAIIAEMAKGFTESEDLEASMNSLVEGALSAANTAMEGKTFVAVGAQMDADAAEGVTGGTATTDAVAAKVGEALQGATGEVATQDFATNVGKLIDDNTAGGITDNTATEEAMKTKVDTTLEAATGQVTADDYAGVGTLIDTNVSGGITAGTASPQAGRALVARTWLDAYAQVAASDFPTVGYQMDEGMAQGLRNGESIVTSAAREVARAAYEAAKSELDINSPSGKFEYLADESIEGYVGPFKRESNTSARIVSDYMSGMYAAAQSQQLAAVNASGGMGTAGQQAVSEGDTIIQVSEGGIVIEIPDGIQTDDDYNEVGKKVATAIGVNYARTARYKGVITHGTA